MFRILFGLMGFESLDKVGLLLICLCFWGYRKFCVYLTRFDNDKYLGRVTIKVVSNVMDLIFCLCGYSVMVGVFDIVLMLVAAGSADLFLMFHSVHVYIYPFLMLIGH